MASCHGVARSAKTEMPRHQHVASLYATPPSGGVRFVFFRYSHGFGASSLRFLRPHRSFALLTPHRGYFMPPRHAARLLIRLAWRLACQFAKLQLGGRAKRAECKSPEGERTKAGGGAAEPRNPCNAEKRYLSPGNLRRKKALQYSDSSLSVTPFHGAQNYFPSSSRGGAHNRALAPA